MHVGPTIERPRPAFGITSVVFAVLSFLLPISLIIVFMDKAKNEDANQQVWAALGAMLAGVVFAGVAAGVTSIVGVVTAIIALIRRERLIWVAIIGLIPNGLILASLTWVILRAQFN